MTKSLHYQVGAATIMTATVRRTLSIMVSLWLLLIFVVLQVGVARAEDGTQSAVSANRANSSDSAGGAVDVADFGSPSIENTVRKELERSGLFLERNLSLPQAEAGPDKFALVGQQVIFDASLSRILDKNNTPIFMWDFGDGGKEEGLRVVHIYEKAGHYKAKLTIKVGDYRTEDEQIVSVFNRQVVLLSDERLSTQALTDINAKIRTYQTDIKSIRLTGSYPTRFLARDAMASKILARQDILDGSSYILSYGLFGLEALQQANQQLDLNINTKRIVIILSDDSPGFGSITYAKFLFEQLHPRSIMFATEDSDFGQLIQDGKLPDNVIEISDSGGAWAFIGFLRGQISALIKRGFPLTSILFLFLLLVSSIVCLAAKRLIGFSDIDVFTSTLAITSIAFLGIIPGMLIFVLLVLVSLLVHVGLYLNQLALLPWNLAKYLGIAITVVFGFLLLGLFYPQSAVSGTIFPVLVIAFTAEVFAFRLVSGGLHAAANYIGQEMAVLIIGSLLLNWELLAWVILAFPGASLVILFIFGVFLERYRGLRLTEFQRFRNILVE